MSSDAREYFDDAWFRVLNSEPFYGIKMFSLKVIETLAIPTMCTDGKSLWFNPNFTLDLSKIHCESVEIHECMHVCLGHHIIMAELEKSEGINFCPMLFNYAADMELNWMIMDMGRTLPEGCVYERRFHGKNFWTIYPVLKEEKERNQEKEIPNPFPENTEESQSGSSGENDDGETQNGNNDSIDNDSSDDSNGASDDTDKNESDNGNGVSAESDDSSSPNDDDSISDSPSDSEDDSSSDSLGDEGGNGSGNATESTNTKPNSHGSIGGVIAPTNEDGEQLEDWEIDELKKELKADLQNASKMAGKRGGGTESIVGEILNRMEPEDIDWSQEVKDYLTETIEVDSTYLNPRECYIPHDIYEPGPDTETAGKIAFFVDTSGSVNRDMFMEQMEKMNEILKEFEYLEFIVIYFHHNVWRIDEFTSDDVPLNLYERTSGGTDYRPPFKTLIESGFEPDVLLIFTDLYCNDYPEDEPDYPVLWLLCRRHFSGEETTPFGKVINIFK